MRMRGRMPFYERSFFMSPHRADGLHLETFYEDHRMHCDFFVSSNFEGYKHIVHGGITFGVLDSLLWSVILMETDKIAMTRKVEMEFFKPILCDTHYKAQSELGAIEGRDILATAWIEDNDEVVYTRVNAIFREMKGFNVKELKERFDFTYTAPEIKAYFLTRAEEG